MSIRFKLPNGWTLSIYKGTAAARCEVAAWPSTEDDALVTSASVWLDFGDGRFDLRCYTLDQMLAAIKKIRNARRPAPATRLETA